MAKHHAKHEHSFPSCVFWLWQILPKASSSKSDEIQNPPVGPHYPRTASLPAISAIPGKWRASGWKKSFQCKAWEGEWLNQFWDLPILLAPLGLCRKIPRTWQLLPGNKCRGFPRKWLHLKNSTHFPSSKRKEKQLSNSNISPLAVLF